MTIHPNESSRQSSNNTENNSTSFSNPSQTQIITRIIHLLNTGINLQETFQNVLIELNNSLNFDRIAVLLKDPEKNVLKVRASVGYSQGVKDVEIPINKDNTGWVIEQNKSLRIDNANPKRKSEAGGSALLVPITHAGTNYGIIIAESLDINQMDTKEVIVNTTGVLLGISIYNSDLVKNINRVRDIDLLLLRISTKMHSLSDNKEIITLASQEIGNSLSASRVHINIGSNESGIRLKDFESIFESDGLQTLRPSNVFSFPILFDDQTIGAINIERNNPLSLEEKKLVDAIAFQLAISIEKSILVENQHKLFESEKRLTDISSKIWSAQTIDLILQTAIKEIGDTMGADEAIIRLD